MANAEVRKAIRVSALRNPWFAAAAVVAVALLAGATIVPHHTEAFDLRLFVLVFAGMVAAEVFSLQFEFRGQGVAWSASEQVRSCDLWAHSQSLSGISVPAGVPELDLFAVGER